VKKILFILLITLATTILHAQDVYLKWAKQIGGSGSYSVGNSIAVDASGNVFTTGSFTGTVDFDPGPETYILNYTGAEWANSDIFISRLDSSGNFKWAKRMGGTGDAYGRSVSIDPSGKGAVYILGTFTGTIDFNPGEDSFLLTSNGLHDFFISKLDLLGNFYWAKSFGGIKDDFGFAMEVDTKNGDVYVTGDFSGRVNFNSDDSLHILTSGPHFDIFILKLDSEGNFVWVKPMFGTGNSKGGAGYALALDPNGSGDIYTTGYFEGTVDFDPNEKGFFYLESSGKNDVFISKLDNSGNFKWAKRMGGVYEDKGNAIAFDPLYEGGVYIMGNFSQTADFDPGQDTFHLTSVHSSDLFVSKLTSTGDFEWAKSVIAKNANQNSTLALNGRFLYTTGYFINPTISFDSIVLTNPSDSKIYEDLFIAKLDFTTSVVLIDSKEHQLTIYPNPTTNELTIAIEGDEFFNLGITLHNTLGEVVYSSPDENISHEKTIDVSTLSTGIYFVELNIDGNKVIEDLTNNNYIRLETLAKEQYTEQDFAKPHVNRCRTRPEIRCFH